MENFVITKREVVASISIIAIMLLIGVLISEKIQESILDKNEIYNKAAKIETTELFQYGMNTNVGNAFVYGDIEAIDTVTYPEIKGQYIYIKKTEMRYERHERTVTEKDKDGKEHEKIEEYYTWDTENTESQCAKNIKFCGVEFPYEKISLPSPSHIDTIHSNMVYSFKSGEFVKVKFEYYGINTNYTGTIFTNLSNGTISDDSEFYNNKNIEETVKYLESDICTICFWIIWVILIILAVFAFYYFDNNWLEYKNK